MEGEARRNKVALAAAQREAVAASRAEARVRERRKTPAQRKAEAAARKEEMRAAAAQRKERRAVERAAARTARTLAEEEEARKAAAARRRLRARAAWLLQRQRDADTARWDETHGGAAEGAMVVWRPARGERGQCGGGTTWQRRQWARYGSGGCGGSP